MRWWGWTVALLLGGESDSWQKESAVRCNILSTGRSDLWNAVTADLLIRQKFWSEKTSFDLTMSLEPDEESEEAEDDDEWC